MDTKASLNPDCVAGPNRETDWRECMFSETALKHTTTPLFAMNSAYNFGEWEMLPPPTREDFPPDTTVRSAPSPTPARRQPRSHRPPPPPPPLLPLCPV